jgi:anaerobic magnesium-protoporphyrin IX monomethyl ester cyclase
MDLLLAHGYFLATDPAEQRIMRPHPPLGLLYLSSHLKARGYDVGVFDSTFQRFGDYERYLARHRPPVVGLAVNLMTKRNVLAMIAAAKRIGARVVLGGPDPPHYADEYLAAGADVVVVGEGEQTLDELLRKDTADVAGVVFRGGRTAARAQIADLDAQPIPDRGAVDIERYMQAWRTRHGFAPLSLITARGCPYTCTWCSRSVFGTTHRRRSPQSVADEVEVLVDRYRPDRLWYADDVFAIHRTWTLDYARELQRRRLRLPFECISRAERIDDAVADALVELGCWRVWIGSESGSQRVLDLMQRRVTVERVLDASALLRRRGIQVGMFIMLGYDGEREEDLRATIAHLKRAAPDVFLTTVSYPIKGTPYYQAVAPRIHGAAPWREHSDRDLTITGRPSRRYYDFARRWIDGEVARDRHWRGGRYLGATKAMVSATLGRIGMTVTGAIA